MEWHDFDEMPKLSHIVDGNGENTYEYDVSDVSVIYKDETYILARYYKNERGFDEWQDIEYGLRIEPPFYWMPLCKPAPRIDVDTLKANADKAFQEFLEGWRMMHIGEEID